MAEITRHIPIDKNTELGRLLGGADEAVVLEINGHSYQLTLEGNPRDHPWTTYNPEAVKLALARSAGAFAGMDTERLKRDLREQRGQHSRGRPA